MRKSILINQNTVHKLNNSFSANFILWQEVLALDMDIVINGIFQLIFYAEYSNNLFV